MKNKVRISVVATISLLTFFMFSSALAQSASDLKTKVFAVTIYEILQPIVPYQEFSGSFRKNFTTSDGKEESIELIPVIHRGKPLIRINGNNFYQFTGLDGTFIRGQMLVQLVDVASRDTVTKNENNSPELKQDTPAQLKAPLDKRIFGVVINEIAKKLVDFDEFSGSYQRKINTSDGKIRVIELAAVIHQGRAVMRVTDNSHISHIPLGSTVTNGRLFIRTYDIADLLAKDKVQVD